MDKYVKIRQIGEGAFGKAILCAHKERNSKKFVIKEISLRQMSLQEQEEAKKEVALLSQLSHPNIVTYRDSFEHMGKLCIVMDYCDAGDLHSRITAQRGINLQEEQVLEWFVQLCLAIKYIHDRKILHRDIKSQNVFLMHTGVVKLGDFGVAKILNATCEMARTFVGTPYYFSPELFQRRPYNNKSDVWALGCVLFELVALRHPFEADNQAALMLKIVKGMPGRVPNVYSYDVKLLLDQMFKKNPEERPSVNGILRKKFIMKRIQKYLGDENVKEELAHTVLHGQHLKKRMPLGPVKNAPSGGAKKPIPIDERPPFVVVDVAKERAKAAREFGARPDWAQPEAPRPLAAPPPQPDRVQRVELMLKERAAQRAFARDDFWQRKLEAARNKARAQQQIFGYSPLVSPMARASPARAERRVPGGDSPAPSPSPLQQLVAERQRYRQRIDDIRHGNALELKAAAAASPAAAANGDNGALKALERARRARPKPIAWDVDLNGELVEPGKAAARPVPVAQPALTAVLSEIGAESEPAAEATAATPREHWGAMRSGDMRRLAEFPLEKPTVLPCAERPPPDRPARKGWLLKPPLEHTAFQALQHKTLEHDSLYLSSLGRQKTFVVKSVADAPHHNPTTANNLSSPDDLTALTSLYEAVLRDNDTDSNVVPELPASAELHARAELPAAAELRSREQHLLRTCSEPDVSRIQPACGDTMKSSSCSLIDTVDTSYDDDKDVVSVIDSRASAEADRPIKQGADGGDNAGDNDSDDASDDDDAEDMMAYQSNLKAAYEQIRADVGRERFRSSFDEELEYDRETFEESAGGGGALEADFFNRLEAIRSKLEAALGDEAFLRAYKTVESVELGDNSVVVDMATLLEDVIGPDKRHLVGEIVQLVLADGCFAQNQPRVESGAQRQRSLRSARVQLAADDASMLKRILPAEHVTDGNNAPIGPNC